MLGQKGRFYLALGLFLAWVGFLAVLALRSSEKPRELPTAHSER